MADPTDKNKISHDRSGMPSPETNFPLIGILTASEKQVHLRQLHMRPIQWNLQKKKMLADTKITRKGDPQPQVGRQCASRSNITPTKTCSANL